MFTPVVITIVVTVVGVLTYALATNAKISEIGRIMYFVGLLWTVYQLTHLSVKL